MKRALITGATRGIGRATAVGLAKQGWDLSLVGRDRARAEEVKKSLKELGAGDVELFLGDLSSLKEVERVAAEFLTRHDRLDVLINNVGAWFSKYEKTVDGFERTLAMNHLAPFVLTGRLRPALEKAAPSRILVVASHAHRGARLNFDDLMHERGYSGLRVYGESKLANILFTRELSKRLHGTGVTANSLHPGFIASNFGRETTSGTWRFLLKLLQPFAKTEEEGAKTSIYLATSSDVARANGKYFSDSREVTPSRAASSDEDAARLWSISETLVARAGVALNA